MTALHLHNISIDVGEASRRLEYRELKFAAIARLEVGTEVSLLICNKLLLTTRA